MQYIYVCHNCYLTFLHVHADLFLRTISTIQSSFPSKKEKRNWRRRSKLRAGFSFFVSFPRRFGTRNTLLRLLRMYLQVYVISLHSTGNPIGHQADPDRQTRLGRVNQRAGDLNQWRRHICWQRLMIRRTRMKPGTRRFQRSDRLETNLTSSFHLAIQYPSRSPLLYHVGSHYYRVYWLIDVDDAVNAVWRISPPRFVPAFHFRNATFLTFPW